MKTKLKVEERMVRTAQGDFMIRYYTQVDYDSHILADKLLKDLESQTNIPVNQILSCLKALGEYMKEKLPQGYILEVPYIGLFKLIANAATTDDPKKAGKEAVRKIRINYLADVDLKKAI